MDEYLIINLTVAGKRYPVRVKRDEEEAYRRASTEINTKLGQYKNHFTGGESQALEDADYIAMTAIQAVAEKARLEIQLELYRDKLGELREKLDSYIKKNIR